MKPSPRACPYCGSPAKRNPCWLAIKHPNWRGDPPCLDFDPPRRGVAGCITALIAIAAAMVLLLSH